MARGMELGRDHLYAQAERAGPGLERRRSRQEALGGERHTDRNGYPLPLAQPVQVS